MSVWVRVWVRDRRAFRRYPAVLPMVHRMHGTLHRGLGWAERLRHLLDSEQGLG